MRKERSDKGKKKVKEVSIAKVVEKAVEVIVAKRDKDEADKWLAIDGGDGTIAESFATKKEANAWIEAQNSDIDDGEPTYFLEAPENAWVEDHSGDEEVPPQGTPVVAKKVKDKVVKDKVVKVYDKPAGSGIRDLGKLHPDLSHYHRVKTAEGKVHVDIADAVAIELREMTLDQVYEKASQVLGIPTSELHLKYSKLNPGMQRMNCGNRIRKALRVAAKEA